MFIYSTHRLGDARKSQRTDFRVLCTGGTSRHCTGDGWSRGRGSLPRNQTYFCNGHVRSSPEDSCFVRTQHRRILPYTYTALSHDRICHDWSTPQRRVRRRWPLPGRSTQARWRTCAPSNRPHPNQPSNHTFPSPLQMCGKRVITSSVHQCYRNRRTRAGGSSLHGGF